MASTFEILPAIDLHGRRVVRLQQGDFAREQVYGEDPIAVARAFVAAGASWIHVVDLDGARAGGRRQGEVMRAIAASVRSEGERVRLQAAGGLRSLGDIDAALGDGMDRVVIGTSAIHDPTTVAEAVARHGPDRIAVSLDVRDGIAVGDGWVEGAAGLPALDLLRRHAASGVTTVAVTAIDRDGLLGGPDLDLLAALCGASDARIIASGGIRSIADLLAAQAVGCRGAIVGRAIYDGHLDLAEALDAVR